MHSTARPVLIGILFLCAAIFVISCEGPVLIGGGNTPASEEAFEWFQTQGLGFVDGGGNSPNQTFVYLTASLGTLNDLFDRIPVSNATMVEFWVTDSADSTTVEPGTYRWSDMNLFAVIYIGLDLGPGGVIADAVAANGFSLKEDFEESMDVNVGDYVYITDATLVVSEAAGVYTFTWELVTADGYTIDGTHTGPVNRSE